MRTLTISTLLSLLIPFAAEACAHHKASPSLPGALALAIMSSLFLCYPVFLLLGVVTDPVLVDPKGNRSFQDHPWTHGALYMAYGLIAASGLVILESFVGGSGTFAPPGRPGSSFAPVPLLAYTTWMIFIVWRGRSALHSGAPRDRGIRRMASHPLSLMVVMGGPLFYMALAWIQDLSLFDDTLMLFPGFLAFALIFHDVLHIVHWSRGRLAGFGTMGGRLRLDELRAGPAPSCPVCAAEIAGAARECAHCSALHHSECYDFLGGCAVYGCRASPGPRADDGR